MVRGCGMWRRCGRCRPCRWPQGRCARAQSLFFAFWSLAWAELGAAARSAALILGYEQSVWDFEIDVDDALFIDHRGLQAVGIKLCTPRNTKECLLVELRRHAQPEASLYTDRAAPPSPEHPPSSRLTWFQVPLAAPAQGAAWRPATRGQHTVGTGHVSRPGSTSLARPRNIAIAI